MILGYLDCASTGISGDKFLGALIDAGYDTESLSALVAALGVEARLEVRSATSAGMRGTAVAVLPEDAQPARRWAGIREMLLAAPLAERVREHALAAFAALAEAEADAHGVSVDDVHFHEVGAVDSIVDVVGAAAGLHALGIEQLVCSPVALGSGTLVCSHGTLPVPAPATARLLAGTPVVGGDAAGELTTPTGAALVRTLATSFGALPPMTLTATGTGLGTRELPVPNVTRLLVGESLPAEENEGAILLATNVDHITPEHVAYVAEVLREAGALDVWQTPAAMKKGRLGAELSALAAREDAPALAHAFVREAGTLGVRLLPMKRHEAPREVARVRTRLGEVRVKLGAGRIRPEHDDVAAIARDTGMPYDEVVRILTEDARHTLAEERDRSRE